MTLREVNGRVVDADGTPLAGARVTIVKSPVPMPEMAMLADEQGRFALRLPEGRFILRADGKAGARGESEVAPVEEREVTIVVGSG